MIADNCADRSITVADQDAIATTVGQITRQWQHVLTQTVSNMFNGSSSSVELLYTLIKDGRALIETPLVTNDEWENMFDTALFTILIPELWQLKSKYPFLAKTNIHCPNGKLPSLPPQFWGYDLPGQFPDAPQYCYNDRIYLLGTPEPVQSWDHNVEMSARFASLPGASELNGKTWGPISTDDIMLSCLRAYTQNGNKNGWSRANPQHSTTLDAIIQHGTAAAGVWPFPVCPLSEAISNMIKAKKSDEWSEHFPCD